MYAGAPTVVASLWRVSDEATTLLMSRFYENMLGRYRDTRAGFATATVMPKALALHEAKRWLRSLGSAERNKHRQRTGDGIKVFAQARGLGPVVTAEKGQLANARPFEHPYYWAAFVLIGDPE